MVKVCIIEAKTEKISQRYAIKLEKAFAENRTGSFHHFAIRQSWEKFVFGEFVLNHEASDNLLQQEVLQHFWSFHSGSRITTVEGQSTINDPATTSSAGPFIDPPTCDESNFDSIRDYAGWVIKRARDTLEMMSYQQGKVRQTRVLFKAARFNLISNLGEDVKQTDGNTRFFYSFIN